MSLSARAFLDRCRSQDIRSADRIFFQLSTYRTLLCCGLRPPTWSLGFGEIRSQQISKRFHDQTDHGTQNGYRENRNENCGDKTKHVEKRLEIQSGTENQPPTV